MDRRSFLKLAAAPFALPVVSQESEFTYMLPEYYHQGWVQGAHTVYDREVVLHHCNDYKRCDWLRSHPFRPAPSPQEGS